MIFKLFSILEIELEMETKIYLRTLSMLYGEGDKIEEDGSNYSVKFRKYTVSVHREDIRVGSLTDNDRNEITYFDFTKYKMEESEDKAVQFITKYLRD